MIGEDNSSMADLDKLMSELRELRRQVNDDFEFNSKAFKEMAAGMRDLVERMTQVEGRTRLQEQRFNKMLSVVEEFLAGSRDSLEALENRVQSLEQGDCSAA